MPGKEPHGVRKVELRQEDDIKYQVRRRATIPSPECSQRKELGEFTPHAFLWRRVFRAVCWTGDLVTGAWAPAPEPPK